MTNLLNLTHTAAFRSERVDRLYQLRRDGPVRIHLVNCPERTSAKRGVNAAASFFFVFALARVGEQRNQQRPGLVDLQALKIDRTYGHEYCLELEKNLESRRRPRAEADDPHRPNPI